MKILHFADLHLGVESYGRLNDARDKARQFLSRYQREFPSAAETLAKHLEEYLTFYRFPEPHWKHIRTSNVIERAFEEVKRKRPFPERDLSSGVWFSLFWRKRD